MFGVYGNDYFKGWKLVKDMVDTLEEAKDIVDNMDAHTYRSYMIINHTSEKDDVIESAFLDTPKTLIKKI